MLWQEHVRNTLFHFYQLWTVKPCFPKWKQNCVNIENYQNDFWYFQRISKLSISYRDMQKTLKNGKEKGLWHSLTSYKYSYRIQHFGNFILNLAWRLARFPFLPCQLSRKISYYFLSRSTESYFTTHERIFFSHDSVFSMILWWHFSSYISGLAGLRGYCTSYPKKL